MQWAMAHMVIFRRPDGKPGYHQADSVDDAVRFVEMLRNQEQVTDARIFRMEEVPIEFRPYYRVEVVVEDPSPSPSLSPSPAATPVNGTADASPASPPPDMLEPLPVEVGAAGKNRRFGRN